jgi:hydroxypyruvate reductase
MVLAGGGEGEPERRRLLALYSEALAAVDGRDAVYRTLQAGRHGKLRAVAIGKAAAAMAEGALEALPGDIEQLLVITKYGHGRPLGPRARIIEAGHPVPDGASLEAGRALLGFLGEVPEETGLLFLISGGASALVEVLPEGYGEAELAEINRLLLGGGQAIDVINAVRKRISCIKGGRLTRYLSGRNTLQLLISDVPGDALNVIGSGMLVPDNSSAPPAGSLPGWVEEMMAQAGPAPVVDDPVFGTIQSRIVASNRTARAAVAAAARETELKVFDHDELLAQAPGLTADSLVAEVCEGEPGIYIWSGETPVTLPPDPGRGGRCQALALEIARRIAGMNGIYFLCGSTDGTDGPTDDAGALVDGTTVARGGREGLDAADALIRADAGTFLEAAGDLLQTGPTGTNVMDIVIACKADER